MTPSPHVLIVDDHPLFREAMALVISAELPGSRLSEASSLPAALEVAAQSPPDLVLLDLNLPGIHGLEGLARMRDALPDAPVVIISAEEDKQLVLQAVNTGADGFISKSSPRDRMRQAIRQVLEGNIYLPPDIIRATPSPSASASGSTPPLSEITLERLTSRQRRVLERMALGESNKQIAWALNITETTVKAHVSAILGKLGVNNRVQAVLVAGEWLERHKSGPEE